MILTTKVKRPGLNDKLTPGLNDKLSVASDQIICNAKFKNKLFFLPYKKNPGVTELPYAKTY